MEGIRKIGQEAEKKDFLKGWGDWTGGSKKIIRKEFLKNKRIQDQFEKNINKKLCEDKNKLVQITNQVDSKIENYTIKEIPYNVKDKQQLNTLNSLVFGPESNSLFSYKKITKPKVEKLVGKIIDPLSLKNDSMKTRKLSEIIHKLNKTKNK